MKVISLIHQDFSKIEFKIFYADEVKDFYPDFIKYSQTCKFKNKCNHIHEPGCAVKEAVLKGVILPSRYENYKTFMKI